MKKALCFLLAIIFVCCVIVHGEDKRFSLEKMITNISHFQDVPSLQTIIDVWTKDYYTIVYQGPQINGEAGWVEEVYYYEDYEGTNDILQFFEYIKGFFKRLGRMISIICEVFITVFDNLQYILPWNNTVPKGAI